MLAEVRLLSFACNLVQGSLAAVIKSQSHVSIYLHQSLSSSLFAGYVYLLVENQAISFEADETLEIQPDKLQLVYKWLHMAHSVLCQPNLQVPTDLDIEAADAATLAVLALLRAAGVEEELVHVRHT